MKNNRNIFLDWLRVISCVLVVLYHYTTRYNELFHVHSGVSVSFGYMG